MHSDGVTAALPSLIRGAAIATATKRRTMLILFFCKIVWPVAVYVGINTLFVERVNGKGRGGWEAGGLFTSIPLVVSRMHGEM